MLRKRGRRGSHAAFLPLQSDDVLLSSGPSLLHPTGPLPGVRVPCLLGTRCRAMLYALVLQIAESFKDVCPSELQSNNVEGALKYV
eukprot:5313997-Pyramimonas_sp.AAC.1